MSQKKIGRALADWAMIIIGTGLFALSVHMFTAPNQIAPGGLTGLVTAINFLIPIPIGTLALLFNIPLLIIGYRFLGKSFMLKTLVAAFLFTLFYDVAFVKVPVYQGDKLLASLYGGALIGCGLALVFRRGGSTGGTDIITRILQKKRPYMKLGKITLYVDLAVIAIATLVFRDMETALYAAVAMFVSSQVMDKVLYGWDTGKLVFIVTNQAKEIALKIADGLGRGSTILKGVGSYSGTDRSVLMIAVGKNQFYKVRTIVNEIDPMAFLIQTDAAQVLGEGFQKHSDSL